MRWESRSLARMKALCCNKNVDDFNGWSAGRCYFVRRALRHNGLVVDLVALKEAKDYRKIVEMREAAKKRRLEKKANKGG